MQARTPQGERYITPTTPHVPIHAVQSLIPRLATTINDIDGLKSQLATGNVDGSMPNWDSLLQRYAMLLGRVHALAGYIAQAAPPPAPSGSTRPNGPHGVPARPPPPTQSSRVGLNVAPSGPSALASSSRAPALAHYFVHPLRPLPSDANPLAPDTFFQVINTQPLPAISSAQGSLLSPTAEENDHLINDDAPTRTERLARLDESALRAQTQAFRGRLERESRRAQALAREIARREDNVDWMLRVGEDEDEDEDEDGEEEGATKSEAIGRGSGGGEPVIGTGEPITLDDDGDDDDDLFGGEDDEDEDGDTVMVSAPDPPPPTDTTIAAQQKPQSPSVPVPNPREGWSIADYLRLMDTGRGPATISGPGVTSVSSVGPNQAPLSAPA